MSCDRFGDYSHLRRHRDRLAMPIVPMRRVLDEAAPVPPAIVELIVPGLADGVSVLPAPVDVVAELEAALARTD